MTIVEMLGQSGVLTLLGMGVVFSFLIIMIISISIVGKLVQALGMDKDLMKPAAVTAPQAERSNAELVAVISSAINEYRKG